MFLTCFLTLIKCQVNMQFEHCLTKYFTHQTASVLSLCSESPMFTVLDMLSVPCAVFHTAPQKREWRIHLFVFF